MVFCCCQQMRKPFWMRSNKHKQEHEKHLTRHTHTHTHTQSSLTVSVTKVTDKQVKDISKYLLNSKKLKRLII